MISKITNKFQSLRAISEAAETENWARDWTRFHTPKAAGVVFPRSTSELSDLLRYCSNEQIRVVPSGGRTGLAGGAIAHQGELVINLSLLNKLDPVNLLSSTIRAQAGVITQQIQNAANQANLYFPVDLASAGSCTIGGNIATNAGGLHVVRYGHIRRWVQSLEVVFMNGEIAELNGDLEKNNTGYDLRNIMIGSEGTLAFVTASTLKLCEGPKDIKTLIVGLDDFKTASTILENLRSRNFVIHAFEAFSKNCFDIVKKCQNLRSPFSKDYPFYLLFEVDTLGSSDTNQLLDSWLEETTASLDLREAFLSQSSQEKKSFWAWRENITESLNSAGKVYKNDLSVPVYLMPEFVNEIERVTSHWFGPENLFLFGHVGDGNIHVNLLKPTAMETKDFLLQCEKHNHILFELVKKYKGSIAAEHGIGLLKKEYLHYCKSPVEISLMKNIKKTFDPLNLLNPGKVFDL